MDKQLVKIREIRGGLGMKEKQKKQWWGTQLWTWIKSNHHKKNYCNSIQTYKVDSVIEVIHVMYVKLPNIINWVDKYVCFVYQNSTANNYQAVNMRCRFEGQSIRGRAFGSYFKQVIM